MDYYNPVPIGVISTFFMAASLAGAAASFFLIWSTIQVRPRLKRMGVYFVSRVHTLVSAISYRPQRQPVFSGTIRIGSTVYASVQQASLILGKSSDDVLQLATARGESVWDVHPEPEIAIRHRVLRLGKSLKKVFVREYSDFQHATLVTRRDRLPIIGPFPRGPNGDDAVLRLAAVASK